MKTIGVIPARYASTRLPGKPLIHIGGMPLIQHTFLNAKQAFLDELWVATDDERIRQCAESFGAPVAMTPSHLCSGSERIAYLVTTGFFPDDALFVNIQGDEPTLEPEAIQQLIHTLKISGSDVSTLIAPLEDLSDLERTSVVKCVTALDGRALYFSRSPIPYCKGGINQLQANCSKLPLPLFWRHLGVYAYRGSFLKELLALPNTPLQQNEDLEQLKFIEHGYTISTTKAKNGGLGIDTQDDVEAFERFLRCKANLFLSQEESVPH